MYVVSEVECTSEYRLYLYAYLSIKFTIFPEEIDGGTVIVFDYLYRVVCSFHGTTCMDMYDKMVCTLCISLTVM